MKLLSTVTLVALAAIGMSACSHTDSDLNKAPGTYESKTESTDANGTTVKKSTTTDVAVDANGKKSATSTTKVTKDPKGLFNKSTATSTTSVHEQ